MERLKQLLRSQFRMASAQWEKEEQCSWQTLECRIASAAMGLLGALRQTSPCFLVRATVVSLAAAEVTDALLQGAVGILGILAGEEQGGRRSALQGEEGEEGQVAGVREKRGRARGQVTAEANVLECAIFAIVWRCETSLCENRSALGTGVRFGDTCAQRVSFIPPSRAPRILLCTHGLARGRECARPLASFAHSVAYSAALIKSQIWCAEATSKKQPAAHFGAMRVPVKTLGTRGRLDFQAVAKQYKFERQSRSADSLRAATMISAAQGALAFGVTRVGFFGATSRAVRKGQLKHLQRSLWLRVRGSVAESRLVSIGEFAAQ